MNKHIETVVLARTQQFSHEVATWLRTLDYLQQENIHLKNRVADLLRHDVSNAFLEKVEYFHNNILNKDAVLSLLRHDIVEMADKLKGICDDCFPHQVLRKEEHLRRDMEKMELEFSRLRSDFNKYIFDVLLPATA